MPGDDAAPTPRGGVDSQCARAGAAQRASRDADPPAGVAGELRGVVTAGVAGRATALVRVGDGARAPGTRAFAAVSLEAGAVGDACR